MSEESAQANDDFTMMDFLLRAGVIVNLFLISLTWWPRFSGTGDQAGLADELFGQTRVSGFRIDVVWLVVSSVACLFACFYFFSNRGERRTAFLNGMFCAAGVVAFVIYMHKLLTSGLLFFG